MRLEFSKASPETKALLHDIIQALPEFSHIDPERVHLISSNSNSRALAYCHEMSSRIQFALGLKPNYVIEIVEKNWNKLGAEERAKVLIHELYHIPRTFSGYLRQHNRRSGFTSYSRNIESQMLHNYINRHPEKSPEEARAFLEKSLFPISETPIEKFI